MSTKKKLGAVVDKHKYWVFSACIITAVSFYFNKTLDNVIQSNKMLNKHLYVRGCVENGCKIKYTECIKKGDIAIQEIEQYIPITD